MKSSLLIFLMLSGVSLAAAADAAPPSIDQICASMNADLKSQCVSLSQGGTFSTAALSECAQYGDSSLMLSCLKTIKNKNYDAATVAVCDKIQFSPNTTKCLQTIVNKQLTRDQIKNCLSKSEDADIISCVAATASQTYSWKINPQNSMQVQSCVMTDHSKAETLAVVPLAQCEARLEIRNQIGMDGKACSEVTAGGAYVKNQDMSVCLSEIKDLKSYWLNADKKSCGYVVNSGNTVVVAKDLSACNDNSDAFDPTTKKITYLGLIAWHGAKGDQCGKFSSDGNGAPTLVRDIDKIYCMNSKLTFFQWEDAQSSKCVAYSACGRNVGEVDVSQCQGKANHFANNWPTLDQWTWSDCYNQSGTNTTIPFDSKNTKVIESCAPDTLYAWRTHEYDVRTEGSSTVDQLFDVNGHVLYLWRTPVGSFGYGQEALRIKLKTDVKWAWINTQSRDCSVLDKEYDLTKTVFADAAGFGNGNYSEYMLCSDGPIASWSIDTSFHLDEVVRDEKFMIKYQDTNNGYVHFDSLSGTRDNNRVPWHYDANWDSTDHRQTDWTPKGLDRKVQNMQKAVAAGQGVVNFAVSEVPSLWNHFSTKIPGYFNYFDNTDKSASMEEWADKAPEACQIGK